MPVTGQVFRVSYHLAPNGELLLDVFGRSTDGQRIARSIRGVRPYFYVGADEERTARALQEIISVEPGPKDGRGAPTLRCYTRYPFDVPKARTRFRRHYEADIFFDTRARIDHGLRYVTLPDIDPVPLSQVTVPERPSVVPRRLYLDIETSDLYGFSRPEDPTAPVLSVAFYDSYAKLYGIIYAGPAVDESAVRAVLPRPIEEKMRFFPVATEPDVLAAFGEILGKVEPDVVSAWNLYGFDAPYLAGRSKRLLEGFTSAEVARVYEAFDIDREGYHGVYRHRGRYALADALAIRRKRKPKQGSYALRVVATELLGFGKVDRPGSVAELLRTDPARFVAYNLFDVHLLRLIDERTGLLPYFLRIAELAEVDSLDFLHNSRLWDGLLLREARLGGIVEMALDSKDFAPKGQREGRAAEVFDTRLGIHPAVVALDFSGEYPGIIRTFNISPETRNPPAGIPAYELPSGGRYRKEPAGLIPRALARVAFLRAEAKATIKKSVPGSPERIEAEDLADALKYIVNSAAGIMGSEHWRMASVEMFEDVTQTARLQLRWNRTRLTDPEWLTSALADGIGGRFTGEVVLGDTDSNYVRLYRDGRPLDPEADFDLLVRIAQRLRDALNATYAEFVGQYGATENLTSVDLEGIFGHLRVLPLAHSETESAKKRYYGDYVWRDGFDLRSQPVDSPGRLKISGLEAKRWNNAPITKEVQTRIIALVLANRPVREIYEYVDGLETEVLAGRRDEALPIPAKMGREMSEYARTYSFGDAAGSEEYVATKDGKRRKKPSAPPWLKAIRAYADLTGKVVVAGDEFRWFFVTSASGPSGDAGGARSLAIPYTQTLDEARAKGLRFDLDRRAMFDKTVHEPAVAVEPRLAETTASLEDEW